MDLRLLRPSVFRVLSSRRRVEILRSLAERPHTPAELSRRLGVTEQTVQYHLDKLADVGLAERSPDARPWAYHQLTGTGRDLVTNPPSTKPLAALAILAGLLAAFLGWLWNEGRPAPLPPNSLASPAPEPWWLDLALSAWVAAMVVTAIALSAWLNMQRAQRST